MQTDNQLIRRIKKKQDKKEYRHIVFAQFLAMLPAILCVACAFAVMALIAYLWLK